MRAHRTERLRALIDDVCKSRTEVVQIGDAYAMALDNLPSDLKSSPKADDMAFERDELRAAASDLSDVINKLIDIANG